MTTIKIADTTASDVHPNTLKLAPARLFVFLQGAADPATRALLAPFGWSEQRQEEAWSLLNELRIATVAPAPAPDPVAEAIAACEAWQGTGLVRARAMLQIAHPEQAAFLFHDFVAGKGIAAVFNVETFLDRRQVLASGAARKASRKADHEALAVMEEIGIDKDVVKELEDLVTTVQTAAPAPAPPVVGTGIDRDEVLRRIYVWVTAWSDMARTVVTRRDQLIRLGLAKRRAPKAKKVVVATPPAPPVATPAPSPAPSPPQAPQLAQHNDIAPESRAA